MDVLSDNFAPVREEVTATDLQVSGVIPDHLDGRYIRIGPNPLTDPDPARYHWFMGEGMAHGVRLRDGRAQWYRNRYVRSGGVAQALGEPGPSGRPHAGIDFSPNTNVIQQGGRTFAIVEGGARPYELTDELGTRGICDFDGTLPGGYAAHPHRDPATGELHAVSYFWGWGNRVQYTVLGTDGRIRRAVDIKVGGNPMIHDFSLTENFVIIYDLPVTFDLDLAAGQLPRPARSALSWLLGRRSIPERVIASAIKHGPGNAGPGRDFPYRWNPGYPARVGVLPREGGSRDIRWFEVDQCFVFHPLNAYEQDDTIVLDVVRHPRMFATERAPEEGAATLNRWTVDLRLGKVSHTLLDGHRQEFPRHNEQRTGLPYRYGYAPGIDPAAPAAPQGTNFTANAVLKHDLAEGTSRTTIRRLGHRRAAEFTFVPNPTQAAEDDGILMGYVHDSETGRSDLQLLDAGTLDDIATIHLPVRVPYGFHGNWLPQRETPL